MNPKKKPEEMPEDSPASPRTRALRAQQRGAAEERAPRRRRQSPPGPAPAGRTQGSRGGREPAQAVSLRKMLLVGGPVLVFEVADQRYGLSVTNVVQIVEMVAITPLPAAPEIVVGVINYHGRVIPIVDVRRRLRLPPQGYTLRTPIIISRIDGRIAGLVVDAVSGVVDLHPEQVEIPEQIFSPETAPLAHIWTGVARLSDGLLLILDLAGFLSPEEEKALAKALARPSVSVEE